MRVQASEVPTIEAADAGRKIGGGAGRVAGCVMGLERTGDVDPAVGAVLQHVAVLKQEVQHAVLNGVRAAAPLRRRACSAPVVLRQARVGKGAEQGLPQCVKVGQRQLREALRRAVLPLVPNARRVRAHGDKLFPRRQQLDDAADGRDASIRQVFARRAAESQQRLAAVFAPAQGQVRIQGAHEIDHALRRVAVFNVDVECPHVAGLDADPERRFGRPHVDV